jgi:hypothetical protein
MDGVDPKPVFESFEGGIFEEWEGMLCVNGTIEGFMKLGGRQEAVSPSV